jgi:hypothetical protein
MIFLLTGNLFLVSLQSTGREEFRAQGCILSVMAAPHRGTRLWRGLSHPTHFHAEVIGFQEHSHSMRVQHRFESIRDLMTDPFLYGKTL